MPFINFQHYSLINSCIQKKTIYLHIKAVQLPRKMFLTLIQQAIQAIKKN